jgi:butyryl-CoA dehydrogenase
MTTTPLQRKLVPTLGFLVNDWLRTSALLSRQRFADHDTETFRMLIEGAADIAADIFEPANRISDDHEPVIVDGRVSLPKETQAAWDAYVDAGFMLASHDSTWDGQQLPRVIDFAAKLPIYCSVGALLPCMLTEANASLLLAHGSETQKEVFARTLLSGRWAGTMCLSETQAGSSLSDITTKALPDGAEYESDPFGPRYRVFGSKMWISSGEHELTENIVHLVLAKTPGPDGGIDPSTKGISLFIVPRYLVHGDGSLGEHNDVTLIGLNHKLGARGIPNTALAFGDGDHRPRGEAGAVGYLVGRPGDGLRQMFHMMNAARIEIGLSAAALGFAGYAASLEYARSRRQGRPMTRAGKDASQPQVPIIEHADVKRMLLAQKSYAEGGIALGLFAARLLDEQETGSPEEAATASTLLSILTPVVKSWPSEWCLEANSLAIQVLGGSGYTRDFPVEQYWRDNRINMIHEGTHGIQALDLLGRKVRADGGSALRALLDRVGETVEAARESGLELQAAALAEAWDGIESATEDAWATDDPQDALPNATAYLQAFGHAVLAWIWLDIAVAALRSSSPEAPGKVAAMSYFFAYELPRIPAWLHVVSRREPLCRDLDPDLL